MRVAGCFILFVFVCNVYFLKNHASPEYPNSPAPVFVADALEREEFLDFGGQLEAEPHHGIETGLADVILAEQSSETTETPTTKQANDENATNLFFTIRSRASEPKLLQTLFLDTKKHIRAAASRLGGSLDKIFTDRPGIPPIKTMFEECYVNTLETTTTVHATSSIVLQSQIMLQELTEEYSRRNPFRTHVITGDIEAMWLRDSMGQFRPYLFGAHQSTRDPQSAQLLAVASQLALNRPHTTGLTPDERYNTKQMFQVTGNCNVNASNNRRFDSPPGRSYISD